MWGYNWIDIIDINDITNCILEVILKVLNGMHRVKRTYFNKMVIGAIGQILGSDFLKL